MSGTVDIRVPKWSSFVEQHADSLARFVPIAAAIVAAAAVLLIGRADGQWQFQRFWEDLVRNVFLGALVTVLLLWLEAEGRKADKRRQDQAARDNFQTEVVQLRRTGHTVATRTPLLNDEPPKDASAELRNRSGSMHQSAAQLSAILERWHQSRAADAHLGWRADAQEAARIVWEYIAHGTRRRLLAYLERVAHEVPKSGSIEKDAYIHADDTFRDAFAKVISRRIATDAAAIEQFVMRLAPAGKGPPPLPNQRPRLEEAGQVAVAVEPLYLLYIDLVRASGEQGSGGDGHPNALSSGVIDCLAREMTYAGDALLSLSRLVDASTDEEIALLLPR